MSKSAKEKVVLSLNFEYKGQKYELFSFECLLAIKESKTVGIHLGLGLT